MSDVVICALDAAAFVSAMALYIVALIALFRWIDGRQRRKKEGRPGGPPHLP